MEGAVSDNRPLKASSSSNIRLCSTAKIRANCLQVKLVWLIGRQEMSRFNQFLREDEILAVTSCNIAQLSVEFCARRLDSRGCSLVVV